jgi:glycosyltransferase involved in cell wall biosynthesis
LKIAQVAPLYERVPPKYYGGTERVVSCLTEELVRQGHEVTLFASGDSITSASLVSVCDQGLRLNSDYADHILYHVLMAERVAKVAGDFDVIHFHLSYLHYPIARRLMTPHFTTIHGRLDLADLVPLYQEFSELPVVSISGRQRNPLPWLNWLGTVYHGLPEDLFALQPNPGRYLAFLGRFSPEKRIDRAIEIAKRAGMPLKIAAKIDKVDWEYYKATVEPQLKDPLIEYVGEIGETEKQEFLGNAYAHLFPIDWPEPFGLVMIEAMACGTPTIAFRRGSVPEVLDDGVTGFVVETIAEAAAALERVPGLSRERCRRVFEERFSASRMVRDYLSVYHRLETEPPIFTPIENPTFD